MKRAQSRSSSRRRIQKLLSTAGSNRSASARIEAFSKEFLGVPYSSTLIGSVEQDEVFVASLDRFDCVTYIETVLALARASNATEFAELLRNLRYDRGLVDSWSCKSVVEQALDEFLKNNRMAGVIVVRPTGDRIR